MKSEILLLDTHAFLWILSQPKKISQSTLELIQDSNTHLQLSVASLWEVAILKSLKRIDLDYSIEHIVDTAKDLLGLEIVEITPQILDLLTELEFHHRDPFDRLIAATTIKNKCTLVSQDQAFDKYLNKYKLKRLK